MSTAPVYFTRNGFFLCRPYLSLPAVVIEECLYPPLPLSVTANTSGQVLALVCHSNKHRQHCRSCNPDSVSWLSVYPSPNFPRCIIFLLILIMWSVALPAVMTAPLFWTDQIDAVCDRISNYTQMNWPLNISDMEFTLAHYRLSLTLLIHFPLNFKTPQATFQQLREKWVKFPWETKTSARGEEKSVLQSVEVIRKAVASTVASQQEVSRFRFQLGGLSVWTLFALPLTEWGSLSALHPPTAQRCAFWVNNYSKLAIRMHVR